MNKVHFSLLIVHCSLFIVHWSMFIDQCSLINVHWSMFIDYCSLIIVHWSLFINHCSLIIVHYFFIFHCSLYIVQRPDLTNTQTWLNRVDEVQQLLFSFTTALEVSMMKKKLLKSYVHHTELSYCNKSGRAIKVETKPAYAKVWPVLAAHDKGRHKRVGSVRIQIDPSPLWHNTL